MKTIFAEIKTHFRDTIQTHKVFFRDLSYSLLRSSFLYITLFLLNCSFTHLLTLYFSLSFSLLNYAFRLKCIFLDDY